MPNLTIYDPIFNHRAIVVKVGLAALIRLRLEGYYVAYYKETGNFRQGYYIIRCNKCRWHYLATIKDKHDLSWRCPVCNEKL